MSLLANVYCGDFGSPPVGPAPVYGALYLASDLRDPAVAAAVRRASAPKHDAHVAAFVVRAPVAQLRAYLAAGGVERWCSLPA